MLVALKRGKHMIEASQEKTGLLMLVALRIMEMVCIYYTMQESKYKKKQKLNWIGNLYYI
jgi:hypothetical protein